MGDSDAGIESLLSDIATRLGDIVNGLDMLRYTIHLQRDTTLNLLLSQLLRNEDPRSLRPYHGQVYSQSGEDGVVAEIFRRLGGPQSRVFIEIGISDGLENNTRFLLEQGWRGLWIEGSPGAATATFAPYVAAGKLQIVQQTVTPENIAGLVAAAGLPDTVDFLSIDIDMYTHWIWEALPVQARVHCVEYNGSIPPSLDLCVPYEAGMNWDSTNFFGAGLKALERIGRSKGVNLVGCDITGINAFFVDAALCADHFLEPFTAETHYELPKYGATHNIGHSRSRVVRRWLHRD